MINDGNAASIRNIYQSPTNQRHANMTLCPHCQQTGISYLRKWWSCSSEPATCAFCGKLSYVTALVSNSIISVCILLLVVMLAFAFNESSSLLAISGLIGSIFCYAYLWRIVPLVPTTAEQSASAKSLSWGMLLITGIFSLFN